MVGMKGRIGMGRIRRIKGRMKGRRGMERIRRMKGRMKGTTESE